MMPDRAVEVSQMGLGLGETRLLCKNEDYLHYPRVGGFISDLLEVGLESHDPRGRLLTQWMPRWMLAPVVALSRTSTTP